MDNEATTFVLRLPLGTFGWDDAKDPAAWMPNPYLAMSAQQQFNHNVEAGHLRLNTPRFERLNWLAQGNALWMI